MKMILLVAINFLLLRLLRPYANAVCFSDDILLSSQLFISEIQNIINAELVDVVSDDNKSLCWTLFGSQLTSNSFIRGSYIDVIEKQKRCGFISNNNVSKGFMYMESISFVNAAELSYYDKGVDFHAHNTTVVFDPRDQVWYNQTVRSNSTRWSTPYIHPLTKRATITLSTTFEWHSTGDNNNHLGILAIDIQLRDVSKASRSDCKNVFIMDKASTILVGSFMESESSAEEVNTSLHEA
jgi:hypothetical protein